MAKMKKTKNFVIHYFDIFHFCFLFRVEEILVKKCYNGLCVRMLYIKLRKVERITFKIKIEEISADVEK